MAPIIGRALLLFPGVRRRRARKAKEHIARLRLELMVQTLWLHHLRQVKQPETKVH